MNEKLFLSSIENIMSSEQTLQFAQEMGMRFNRLMSYYKCAMMEIETKFRVLKEEYSLRHDRNPINSIESRLKRMQSIKEKLERRGEPLSLTAIEEELNDVAGIRVICSFTEDVYTIAETFLKQDDITLIEKKDYIKNPKENGYRSLHLIVAVPIFLENEKRIMKVEVQLRTIAMDCWANLEHQLNYKKDYDFTEKMRKELADCAMLSAQLDEKMDELRKKVSI
ncbi:MAG: GTP pyrophosphokinase family protein [Lachnospiraceae bacterium]|nr:GTP pyrophosphokinase family protein [Lachnospiraceae bacterium]